MSHWENSDLRSTVSIISSSVFSEYDDSQEEDDVWEPPEMKFVPVPVKTEIIEEDDGDGGRERSARKSTKRFNLVAEDCEEEDDSDGDDYDPEDDEDWGGKSKKKDKRRSSGGRKSKVTKRQSSKVASTSTTTPSKKATRPPPVTPEERREKERERKRLVRLKEKLKKEDDDEEWDKAEVVEDGEKETSVGGDDGGRRKKRISEMTPEEAERVRAQWRAQREHRKIRNAIKKELENDSEQEDVDVAVDDFDPNIENDEQVSGAIRKAGKRGSTGGGKPKGIKKQPSKVASTTTPTEKATMSEERREKERERKRLARLRAKSEREDESWDTATRNTTRPPPITPEERREREKERKRLARLKAKLKKENEEGDKSEGEKVGGEASKKGEGRRKKRISEMTPEEAERIRAQWRAQRERRRQTKGEPGNDSELRPNITPRGMSTLSTGGGDRRKRVSEMTDEEREFIRAQCNAYRERRRSTRTPEDRRQEAQRVQMYRMARRARMSEDELKMTKLESFLKYTARMASLTPEELQRRKEKKREAGRRRWEMIKQIPGEQERITQMNKLWRHNMSPDKRERNLEKMRERHRKMLEATTTDPHKLEQMKQQWKQNDLKRQQKQMLYGLPGIRARKMKGYTKSVEDQIRKRRVDGGHHLTQEERKERQRLNTKRTRVRQKLKIQQMLESGMTMETIQEQLEPPDKREQRLIKNRLKRQRCLLRRKMIACGANEEEIQRSIKELEATFQTPVNFKPRKPVKWTPVDARDLEVVGEDWVEEQLNSFKATPTVINLSSSAVKSSSSDNEDTTATPSTSGPPPLQRAPRGRGRVPNSCDNNQQVNSSSVETFTPSVYATQFHQNIYQTPLSQYSHQTSTPIYPHQQPQSQPHNDHAHFLQNIMDGVKPQETASATFTTPMLSHQVPSYQYAADTATNAGSSHNEDCVSSYGDDVEVNDFDNSPPNSPPGGGEDHEEYSSSSSYYNHYQQHLTTQPTMLPSTSTFKVPEKKKRKRNRKPTVYVPRPGARRRTKRMDVIRDVICDLCGEYYNRAYLNEHKRYNHNPHFDFQAKTCRICNQVFKIPSKWYSHYLRDHVNAGKEPEVKPIMCPECGKTFKSKEGYRKHYRFTHGEEYKIEDYKVCPICPGDRKYKEEANYQDHMKRSHPDYMAGDHQCSRCDEGFLNEKVLREHVKITHPHNYFPCGYCDVIRFTQLGLNFHLVRCPKLSKPARIEILEKWKQEEDGRPFCQDRMPINCQFCERAMNMSSLRLHYRVVHGVAEDKAFTCPQCKKEFRLRHFLAAHWEESHSKPLDEIREYLRELHAENKEGLTVEPKRRKGPVAKHTRGKKPKLPRVKRSGKMVSESEEEEEASGGHHSSAKKRWRRNIEVICEEDDTSQDESSDDDSSDDDSSE